MPGWRSLIRPQDAVWLLLFSALAAVSTSPSPQEIAILVALGLLQVVEPRVRYLNDERGMVVAILLKLALCYLLIGFTGGISSTYYLILLLPVVAAATTLGPVGASLITVLACASYLSFLLFLDWRRYELAPAAFGELGLRVVFLPVVAFLTHQLAESNRREAKKYQAAVTQLEQANRSLQAAEAAVRRSDRLAALGQLSAGLAHELRNPLGTMRASAELLVRNVADGNDLAREMAGFIASEVDRANSLITRFLDFARPLELRRRQVNIDQVIESAVSELRRHNAASGVSVHTNFSPDLPAVNVDPELMQRVFYNLLSNAAQASQPGSTITVKTRTAGARVDVAVIDRGSGIAPENVENIFNPFFTTRSDGVGLGLAIVSKILDEHGGEIVVESEPGSGSVFRVYLPVAAE